MNKRILIYLSPFLLLLLFFTGCGGPSASDTVEEFMTAMNYGDYERARELASPDSQTAIDWAESFSSMRDNEKYEEFYITREEINGSYGKVYYELESDGEEHFLKVKENAEGDWVVLFSKADLGDGRNDESDGFNLDKLLDGEDLADMADEHGALGDPEEVAEQFLMAMAYGDYEKAEKLASEESSAAIGMVKGSSPGGTGSDDFDIVDIDRNGNYATVYYKEDGDPKKKEIKLRKQKSKKWVVIFSKSDYNDDVDVDLDIDSDVDVDWSIDSDEGMDLDLHIDTKKNKK